MPLPPSQELSSSADLPEVNEEVIAARQALLRFAAAEGILEGLVVGAPGADSAYTDVESVRRHATVDELLHAVARIPEAAEERQGYEATSLYASLLQLAEAFDILIDQYSLVYGDAIALAEAMQSGWHALGGCRHEDPESSDSTEAAVRMRENLAPTEALLARLERLSLEERRKVLDRFRQSAGEPWTAEARRLALHAIDTCLHSEIGVTLERALDPARRPAALAGGGAEEAFRLAVADLLLARITEGPAHPSVPLSLSRSFSDLLGGG